MNPAATPKDFFPRDECVLRTYFPSDGELTPPPLTLTAPRPLYEWVKHGLVVSAWGGRIFTLVERGVVPWYLR